MKKDCIKEFQLANDIKTSAQAQTMFDSAITCLFGEVKKAGKARTEYGIFKLKTLKEKKGRNPLTGAELIIPARKTIGFKMSKSYTID